jgi:hypothetical protein
MDDDTPAITLELRLGHDVRMKVRIEAAEDVSLPTPGEVPVWEARLPTWQEVFDVGFVLMKEADEIRIG